MESVLATNILLILILIVLLLALIGIGWIAIYSVNLFWIKEQMNKANEDLHYIKRNAIAIKEDTSSLTLRLTNGYAGYMRDRLLIFKNLIFIIFLFLTSNAYAEDCYEYRGNIKNILWNCEPGDILDYRKYYDTEEYESVVDDHLINIMTSYCRFDHEIVTIRNENFRSISCVYKNDYYEEIKAAKEKENPFTKKIENE